MARQPINIFYSPTATVEQGETYPLSGFPLHTVGNNNYGVSMSLTGIKHGDFADAGEATNIGPLNNVTDGPQINTNVTIPLTALTGTTRMRITFMRNAYSTACLVGCTKRSN